MTDERDELRLRLKKENILIEKPGERESEEFLYWFSFPKEGLISEPGVCFNALSEPVADELIKLYKKFKTDREEMLKDD